MACLILFPTFSFVTCKGTKKLKRAGSLSGNLFNQLELGLLYEHCDMMNHRSILICMIDTQGK